jgi:hypothetical protein
MTSHADCYLDNGNFSRQDQGQDINNTYCECNKMRADCENAGLEDILWTWNFSLRLVKYAEQAVSN